MACKKLNHFSQPTRLIRIVVRLGVLSILTMGLFVLLLPISWAANLGDLDPTFGTGGLVTTTTDSLIAITDVALQSDGKIIVGGIDLDNGAFFMARFTSNGQRDASFGYNGFLTTTIGYYSQMHAVAVQSNNKVIAAGSSQSGGYTAFTLVRYDTNGTRDLTFGQAGVVTTPLNADALINDVAVQPDGKIVAVGTRFYSGAEMVIARYQTDGDLDEQFGNDGILYPKIGLEAWGQAIAIQGDGKIVAGGNSYNANDTRSFALTRYDTNGQLDNTFGLGGIVTTTVDTYVYGEAVAIQPDGKIILGGSSENHELVLALLRYDVDGSLDGAFGMGGVVTTSISGRCSGNDLAIQPGGKIVVSGSCFGDEFSVALARYDTGGHLDGTFGQNGVVTTTIGGPSISSQTDGNIIMAGSAGNSIVLARYIGDLPPMFLVNDPATGSPLITPTLGISLTTARPTFDWEDATDDVGVTYYTLQLTPGNQALTLQESTEFTTLVSNYTPVVDLANNSYTWTVQAHDLVGHVTSVQNPAHFAIAVKTVYLPIVLK